MSSCEEPTENCYYERGHIIDMNTKPNAIKCTICGYHWEGCRDEYDFLILFRVFLPFYHGGPGFYACATHSRKKYDDDGNMVEDSLLNQCLSKCPLGERGHYSMLEFRHLTDMGKAALFPLVKTKKALLQ